jgi:transcriptional regulator with XRE-family HTH domain
MLDLQTLGPEIVRLRREKRMTQAELAKRARISRSTVAALEAGALRELGYNKIAAILAVLGADLALTTANQGRPTLEDLRQESER